MAINKTIMQKLRLDAESDDDFRRWLVLLFEPDLVSPSSNQSATGTAEKSKSNKAPTNSPNRSPKKATKNKTPSFDVLVAATRQAIEKATEVDLNRIHHNFDYDCQAYEEVHRNLIKLIEHERLDLVMELAIELMKKGSHQMEMSDEGEMMEEIEECLDSVIEAVKDSSLSRDAKLTWQQDMMNADRVSCVCETGLRFIAC